ncbi:MAG: RnfABCDGE type electron transport complex subunit G [Bacteroidales bacterium]|nr:RnfABCDGE type electron transport complex subunit G [Bacteroidales bacterium]MCF8402893.1 RnfABCDGE type electron transport complex subunit G [Bacteroidales bacterium]
MAKKESTFTNMVLTLFVVTAIAALALGGVYNATKEPIALAKRLKIEKAIGEVLPAFDSIVEYKRLPEGGKDSLTFYTATNAGEEVGTAIRTYTDNGFSGRFWIMVGFVDGDVISGTSVLEHKETPGLGDKMNKSKSDWSLQFDGKNLAQTNLKVKKDGGEVDAITAATISSRAFCDAVNRAYNSYKNQKED